MAIFDDKILPTPPTKRYGLFVFSSIYQITPNVGSYALLWAMPRLRLQRVLLDICHFEPL